MHVYIQPGPCACNTLAKHLHTCIEYVSGDHVSSLNGPWTLFDPALDIKDSKTVNKRSGEQLVFGLISQTLISQRLCFIFTIYKNKREQ